MLIQAASGIADYFEYLLSEKGSKALPEGIKEINGEIQFLLDGKHIPAAEFISMLTNDNKEADCCKEDCYLKKAASRVGKQVLMLDGDGDAANS